MKSKMGEIDILIKETLSKEEATFFDSLEERGLFAEILGLYKGKNAWFLIVSNILILVFLGLLVYSAIQYFGAEAITMSIKWGLASMGCLLMISMLKIYA